MKIFETSPQFRRKYQRGMNLMEILVVISIIAVLTAIALPGFKAMIDSARTARDTTNLRSLINATFNWASDNGEKLPSPQYPGGHQGSPPESWDFAQTGTGLWCDGTIFYAVYRDAADQNGKFSAGPSRATDGAHLVGTIFESEASVKTDPSELDWYRHTYAMNANLQYDRIHELSNSPNPWLTEKSHVNIEKQSQAMIFIDCIDQNVVMAEDFKMIIDTGEKRRRDYVLAAYLDGHVAKLREADIPTGDVSSDREASAFWRGVGVR